MSNALALAGVTAVIKDLLDNALIDGSISDAVGAPVSVSVMAPDRVETGDDEEPRLNLFLYHVAPNAALRNIDLPSRNDRGVRRSNPPLALDLHYLLTAYGANDYEAEILLGYAMLMLHDSPVLSRAAIRRALAAPALIDGGILPPAVGALAASDLADQMELVKIVPHSITTDEMAKLWTAFQARYRPSAAYSASVVLIESVLPTVSPLPVLTIGAVDPETGRERGVVVQPSLVPPYPTLASAAPPDAQTAVRLGEELALSGHTLAGDEVAVRFTHVRTTHTLELEPEPGATAALVTVRMPTDPPPAATPDASPLNPANWLAGVYVVAVVIRTPGEAERVTNELPLLLAPRLTGIAAADGGDGVTTLTVQVSPPVRRTQRIRLVVGTAEFAPDGFAGDSTAALTFPVSGVPSGEQWVRLRVDGVESLLIDRSDTPPTFDISQQVTIP